VKNRTDWDGSAEFKFKDESKVRLPVALVDLDRMILRHEETTVPSETKRGLRKVRDIESEKFMIKQLAAESIQDAYRYLVKRRHNYFRVHI
jgi:hypothetical protein